MTALLVRRCGAATSLQDQGRIGHQRLGISPAGAMDASALALANTLVGNDPPTAALELAFVGAELAVEGGAVRLALAGAAMPLAVDGRAVTEGTSVTVGDGAVVTLGNARHGVFAYLAVAGGFVATPRLGSVSLHARNGLGGFDGRPVRAGDRLPLRLEAPGGPERRLTLPSPRVADTPFRIVRGPQDDRATEAELEQLVTTAWKLSERGDRMAYRLVGPPLHLVGGHNIVSDGIAPGSIQIPGSGEPLVLLADRQTTGGFPKLATICSADLARFAQTRPGTAIRFETISVEAAVALARREAERRKAMLAAVEPVMEAWWTSERLLARNLIGGVTSG